MSPKVYEKAVSATIWFTLVVVMLLMMFPVLWVILTSLKPGRMTFAIPPVWIFRPTLQNYRFLFFDSRFALGVDIVGSMTNSFIVASTSTAVTIGASMYAAYALSRFRFPGKRLMAVVIIATRMLPPIGTIIPFFLLIHSMGILDTRISLIIAYTALNLPLATWMLRGFIDEVPLELDDAAIVDGCGRGRTLWTIIAPLTAPGLVATAVFAYVLSWNDFALALVLTLRRAKTLPLLVTAFITEEGVFWGPMSAAAIIVFIPPIILFLLTYKHLAKGLTLGAVKG